MRGREEKMVEDIGRNRLEEKSMIGRERKGRRGEEYSIRYNSISII
jgi:hypothetical protein